MPFEIRKFAIIAFTYTITSVIVEGLFSHMRYNQAGSRSRTKDDKAVDIISAKKCEAVDVDPSTPLVKLIVDEESALKDDLPW